MSGTVCFFSAIESQSHFDACVDAGVDRLLASYYALQKRNKNLLKDRARKNPKLKFFIDSGAHTFITDWEKFKDWTRDDFEKYVQNYVAWIRKNKKYIFCAVELDIDYCLNMVLTGNKDATVGTTIVESWQKQYFQPLEKEGIPIVYVWHEERQLQGWEEMCQKFAYVGLPGELSKEKNFYQFRNIATKYSVKVHGFGATKQIDYSEAGWYSVDSTSWKSGEMYGVFIDWDEKAERLLFIAKDRKMRHLYKDKMLKAGCDADAIIDDTDYKAITKWNLIQCNGVHMYYRKKYRKRIFPYDLRLPPVEILESAERRTIKFYSNKILFDKRFTKHKAESFSDRRTHLCAISLVQHGDYLRLLVNDDYLEFLKEYFPGLCAPLVKDMSIFQKEMSVFLLPRQQRAMSRGIMPVEEHDRSPKRRTGVSFELADLLDPAPEPELLKLL